MLEYLFFPKLEPICEEPIVISSTEPQPQGYYVASSGICYGSSNIAIGHNSGYRVSNSYNGFYGISSLSSEVIEADYSVLEPVIIGDAGVG